MADCDNALRINPNSFAAYLCRAESYLRQGAPDRAVEQVNQALLTAQALDQPSPLPNDLLQSVQTAIKDAPRSPAAPVSQAPVATVSPPSRAAAPPDPPQPAVVPQPAPTDVKPNLEPPVAPVPSGVRKQATAGNADDYQRLGRARSSEGNFQEAVNLLNRAIELDPRLASSYNARGYAYLRLLRFDAAIADFSEAIRLNPAYANAYHNRAVSRLRKGDRTGAAQDDRRAAELMVNKKRPSKPVTAHR
jgi:tetratricopeptide (TPR) repeat protein